jgi:hypothetical protein
MSITDELTETLKNYFGFNTFSLSQAEASKSLLEGHHTLVVMPTGSGKSLIFQLAARCLPGLTLVISPLIALMKNQVDNSDAEKSGTWAGTTEALKAGWLPVFVLNHPAMPEGNRSLIQKGALPFPHPFPEHFSKLPGWLQKNGAITKTNMTQSGPF